ncbi:hypothetical protein EVAR_32032_1 [Eumeta japonica]|uniref:Uncharacterized protein n=1 Tax=Eumeta variegata TaxID=151549 RepID=A0A4C1WLZ5_EUMVA|nr:hypothetical protein EVAR_32032_1 [Eumeta japonica]
MTYRKTPNNATGLSPAEMMFKRLYRTRIDLVKREDTERESKNENLEINKEFKTGDRVQIRMYDNNKWKFGDIINRCGKLHYEIEVDGKIHHRHVDQIIKTYCMSDNQYPPDTYQFNPMQPRETVQVTAERKESTPIQRVPEETIHIIPSPGPINKPASPAREQKELQQEQEPTLPTVVPTEPTNTNMYLPSPIAVRRPQRIRKVPDRLNL